MAAGRFGRIAATSFYPGKNLGAYGDAGAVITDDDDLARRVRLMGAHGSSAKYQHTHVGSTRGWTPCRPWCSGRSCVDCTSGTPSAVRRQRSTTTCWRSPGLRLPVTLPGNEHVWHLYVVRVSDRDDVLRRLRAEGIGASVHYPTPVHLTPAMAEFGSGKGSMPVTEQAAGEILSLPIYPGITVGQQERVADVLRSALGAGSA